MYSFVLQLVLLSSVLALPEVRHHHRRTTTTSLGQAITTLIPSKTPTQIPTTIEQTSLDKSDIPTSAPLLTLSKTISTALPKSVLINIEAVTSHVASTTSVAISAASVDAFAQIASDDPAVTFGKRPHVVLPINMASNAPIETNKFYANLFLGGRTNTAFMQPYEVWWEKNSPYGMCVGQVDDNQKVFASGTPAPYFINPLDLCSLGFSATAFTSAANLSTSSPQIMSVNAIVQQGSASITLPLISGQSFVTAIYKDAIPLLFTSYAITSVVQVAFTEGSKYRISLNDGKQWLLYAFGNPFTLALNNTQTLLADGVFNGYLQLAKIPLGDTKAEAIYDSHAGIYATGVSITGGAIGSVGSYTLTYATNTAGTLLNFALSHHVSSLYSGAVLTTVKLYSLAKGVMIALSGNSWIFQESDLPVNIAFLPEGVSASTYTSANLQAIAAAANADAVVDFGPATDLNSMYYSGKALAKYALVCLSIHDVLQNPSLSNTCIQKLEAAFDVFIQNAQIYPLIYDTTWGGLISIQGFTEGSLSDFGNTWYNDHHFHYGYFLHAAAIIGHIDPAWVTTNVRTVINNMIRDFANPSTADIYYPLFRSFDWFSGHSWSTGIFESGDGKDEESSSEDYNALYAMKLWASVIGDASMEARANLMLAIERRAMNEYMLMGPTNSIQPSQFVDNYVSGILFENKADHTTYFSAREECIQGIHMIPATPISPYIRNAAFIQQEWAATLATIAPTITDGWKGIVYADYAIADPQTAYTLFSSPSFDPAWLDGGASLTWYLTFSAGLLANGSTQPSGVSSPSSTYVSPPASSSATCGAAVYSASSYICYNGATLCPIVESVVYQLCGESCYSPLLYGCSSGNLVPASKRSTFVTSQISASVMPTGASTPPSAIDVQRCGEAYYYTNQYACYGSTLCPVQDGIKYQLCGSSCYNPKLYTCSSESLTSSNLRRWFEVFLFS